ncbi:MAG: hypothetical protein FJW68_00885 [Actinobacteria bacterium]|nr:hypothetical protein [Actinomycetota bacterium]
MNKGLKFSSITGCILIFILTLFIIFTAVSCCPVGQLKTAGSDSGVTQSSAAKTVTETTAEIEKPQKDNKTDNAKENANAQKDMADLIVVDSPTPGQAISSPLTITGRARGTWYFEADFPIKLFDADGNLIASHYGQAQGEWMTEDFVPFIAEIVFEAPGTETGTLVLEKDNPSGLAEHDEKIEIPVKFD